MPTQQQQQADPALVALVVAYQAQSVGLRGRLERFVRGLWRSLGVYRNDQQAEYVREVVPVVLGAQQQMASLTAAFDAHQRQIALRTPFSITPIDPKKVTGEAARLGTPPQEVHARPFHLVWRQLHDLPHDPGSIEKAITAGEGRAVELALDDLQLAKNHADTEASKQDDKVRWTRRILEGPSSCGLCIVASTQRYHSAELKPIHGGCDCSFEHVYGDEDPGQIIDFERLADIHDKIDERFGSSSSSARAVGAGINARGLALHYRDVLVTHEHGELGPVLGVRGASFVGPGDL